MLDGDVEEVTFKNIVYENPYVNNNLPITHTNKNLDILLGVKGSLIQFLAFDVGVRSAIFKNMYFYANDPLEFNKFNLLYDKGNTSLFQGILSLGYFKNNTLGTTLSAKFNAYNTDELDKAWHKPKFEFDYSFWYNFYDKIKLSADLFVLTGIEAVDVREIVPVSNTLDGAIDLNVKVDYILSDKYSAFVSVNNLLNNNYQLYNKYPVRGLLAIVGLSISF
jgi:outer membrane cobalamin receptor